MDWSKIFSYSVLVDIIVPMIAAFLGGGITMWGVVRTIKYERNNSREQALQAAKPWIFSLDEFEHYDYKNAGDIKLEGNAPMESKPTLSFIFRNTDNGIGIIDKFVTENNEYIPSIGRILDKNSVNHVTVLLNENENLKDMYFVVRDVYGNKYRYRAFQTGKAGKGNHIEEIGLIKEKYITLKGGKVKA